MIKAAARGSATARHRRAHLEPFHPDTSRGPQAHAPGVSKKRQSARFGRLHAGLQALRLRAVGRSCGTVVRAAQPSAFRLHDTQLQSEVIDVPHSRQSRSRLQALDERLLRLCCAWRKPAHRACQPAAERKRDTAMHDPDRRRRSARAVEHEGVPPMRSRAEPPALAQRAAHTAARSRGIRPDTARRQPEAAFNLRPIAANRPAGSGCQGCRPAGGAPRARRNASLRAA
mgnify:CR=1 FL=1